MEIPALPSAAQPSRSPHLPGWPPPMHHCHRCPAPSEGYRILHSSIYQWDFQDPTDGGTLVPYLWPYLVAQKKQAFYMVGTSKLGTWNGHWIYLWKSLSYIQYICMCSFIYLLRSYTLYCMYMCVYIYIIIYGRGGKLTVFHFGSFSLNLWKLRSRRTVGSVAMSIFPAPTGFNSHVMLGSICFT